MFKRIGNSFCQQIAHHFDIELIGRIDA